MTELPIENKKLKLLIDTHSNGSQNAFAEMIGISQTHINRLFRIDERNNEYPNIVKSKSTLKAIVDKFDYATIEWFKKNDLVVNFKSEIKEVPIDDFMEAEYLPVKAQAGYLTGLEQDEPIALKKMLVPKEFEKGFYKVIEIEGDSMNDGTDRSIRDGDKLLLQEIEGGDYLKKTLPYRTNLFVIVSKEGIVCKQIVGQDLINECITCHSFNVNHTDYEICFEDIYQLFYVKKLVERKIKF